MRKLATDKPPATGRRTETESIGRGEARNRQLHYRAVPKPRCLRSIDALHLRSLPAFQRRLRRAIAQACQTFRSEETTTRYAGQHSSCGHAAIFLAEAGRLDSFRGEERVFYDIDFRGARQGSLEERRSGWIFGCPGPERLPGRVTEIFERSSADPPSGEEETAPRGGTPTGDELEGRINRYVFHDFWTIYRTEVLQHQTLEAYGDNPIFGHIFADFRGLIASDQAVAFADEGFFRDGNPPSWGGEAKKRFLPLIQHRNRAEHSRHECAVNYMLDGRALYMSTLGPHLPSIPEAHRIPVEFIVYAHVHPLKATIVNKWQLGRVVSQILLLGTMRLCALKDLKWLHAAGRSLGSLEESTQSARKAIAFTEIVSSGPETNVAAERQKKSREAMARIAEAHSKLNGITGDFLKETGDGPLYRIERSRYYVQQFEENIKLLRIKRLEGDQPYDQFIRRRLGSEFDFINRLGIRYERAASSIVTLDQNYLAITQNALVERATKIDEDTMSIQSEIRKIQEWGEFALLAALVPYYVTHLLDLIINEQYVPGLTAGIWGVFGVIAIYRMFKTVGYATILDLTLPIVLAVAWQGLIGRTFRRDPSHLRSPPTCSMQPKERFSRSRKNCWNSGTSNSPFSTSCAV